MGPVLHLLVRAVEIFKALAKVPFCRHDAHCVLEIDRGDSGFERDGHHVEPEKTCHAGSVDVGFAVEKRAIIGFAIVDDGLAGFGFGLAPAIRVCQVNVMHADDAVSFRQELLEDVCAIQTPGKHEKTARELHQDETGQ
jgi:hypothetical protein